MAAEAGTRDRPAQPVEALEALRRARRVRHERVSVRARAMAVSSAHRVVSGAHATVAREPVAARAEEPRVTAGLAAQAARARPAHPAARAARAPEAVVGSRRAMAAVRTQSRSHRSQAVFLTRSRCRPPRSTGWSSPEVAARSWRAIFRTVLADPRSSRLPVSPTTSQRPIRWCTGPPTPLVTKASSRATLARRVLRRTRPKRKEHGAL